MPPEALGYPINTVKSDGERARAGLASLTGDERLDASAIKNLPDNVPPVPVPAPTTKDYNLRIAPSGQMWWVEVSATAPSPTPTPVVPQTPLSGVVTLGGGIERALGSVLSASAGSLSAGGILSGGTEVVSGAVTAETLPPLLAVSALGGGTEAASGDVLELGPLTATAALSGGTEAASGDVDTLLPLAAASALGGGTETVSGDFLAIVPLSGAVAFGGGTEVVSGHAVLDTSGTSYLAIGTDTTWTAAEAKAGTSGQGDALACPSFDSGTRYVAFFRPADQGAFTAIYVYAAGFPNTINQISAWTKSTLTIDGTSYNVLASDAAFKSSASGLIFEVV